MAITWDWNDKLGTVDVLDTFNNKMFTNNLYRGNCLMIEVNEFTDDKGVDRYNLHNFFMDKEHAKRILGLDRKDKASFGQNALSESCNRYVHFHLDATRKESREIAKLLMDASWKHGITVTLYNPNDKKEEA